MSPDQGRELRIRLGDLMETRRILLDLRWQDVADRSGLSRTTLNDIRRGKIERIQALTKRAIERALEWTAGSVDAILAGGNPVPLGSQPAEDREQGGAADGVEDGREPASGELSFPEALAAHREALLQLRRVAAADPNVPDEVVNLLDDMNMMAVALEYGGVTQVRKAIADSYQRGQLSEQPSHRAG